MIIQEAIEQLISLKEHCRMMQDTIFQKDVEAIETILAEYEKLEENQIWSEATIEGLKKDFIQKNKIKAKIREYKKKIEELKDSQIFTQTEYEGAIRFGQSLLEEKE